MNTIITLALILTNQAPLKTVTASAQESVVSNDKKSKKVCKTFQSTSSRLVKDRICKTQMEWEADNLKSAIEFDRMRVEGMRVEQTGGPDF